MISFVAPFKGRVVGHSSSIHNFSSFNINGRLPLTLFGYRVAIMPTSRSLKIWQMVQNFNLESIPMDLKGSMKLHEGLNRTYVIPDPVGTFFCLEVASWVS